MAKDEKPKQEPKPAQAQKPVQKKEAAPKKEATPKSDAPQLPAPPARLAIYYREKVVPELMQKFGYKTVMQVPRLGKITLNMGVGETTTDKKSSSRLSRRLHGDAARGEDVRVLRPPGEHRHAAHPRFPRRVEPRF